MITTDYFTYDKETRTLVAMASTGELHNLFRPGKGAPAHLDVESTRTGRVLRFTVVSHRTEDGDLISWTYKADAEDVGNLTLTIYND